MTLTWLPHLPIDTHQEVIWLDIAMNEVARVDILNERNLITVGMRGEKT